MSFSPDTRLARILCARLCHDLGGAVGGLTGTLDLVRSADDEMMVMARETGVALRQRLRLCAAAWGGPTAEHDAAELADMLLGSPASPRVRFDLDGLAPGTLLPAAIVPVALNAALLGAEALPRGGTVVLSGTAEAGLVVLPQPHRAPAPGAGTVSWPPLLLRLLAGAAAEEGLAAGPRQVVAPLLLAMLAELGWRASLGPGPGPQPLLLGAA
ncbi:histidine phosphotransferase family protein [Paeniroseomonas aquatica]|uniref:Histidine phosphotransferase family protein n=1 Tax=Paeniroseomonas aquatica TaxID=373043 RepID=A0ABT8ABG4_9PROT|nr:histidine phosphotransferase family protein [Paeniroseomonas aquatica]MDN3567079.1 histidine phosphotransferase family protein [Paeniroseomonas aquatica]